MISKNYPKTLEDHIHQFGGNETKTFLTKEEHANFLLENNEVSLKD